MSFTYFIKVERLPMASDILQLMNVMFNSMRFNNTSAL